MEKRHREELSLREDVQLVLHKSICAACRRYEKQSALLERIFKSKNDTALPADHDHSTEELENKILRDLGTGDK